MAHFINVHFIETIIYKHDLHTTYKVYIKRGRNLLSRVVAFFKGWNYGQYFHIILKQFFSLHNKDYIIQLTKTTVLDP